MDAGDRSFGTYLVEGHPYPRVILGGDQFLDYWGPQKDARLGTQQGAFEIMRAAYEAGVRGFDLSMNDHVRLAFEQVQQETGCGAVGIANVNWKLGLHSGDSPLWNIRGRVVATVLRNCLGGEADRLRMENTGAWREWFECADGSNPLSYEEIANWSLDEEDYRQRLRDYRGLATFCLVGSDYGDWCIALGRTDILNRMIVCAREEGFIPISVGHWTSLSLPVFEQLDFPGHWVMVCVDRQLLSVGQMIAAVTAARKPITAFQVLGHGRLSGRMAEAISFVRDTINPFSIVLGVCSPNQAIQTFGLLRELMPNYQPP